MSLSGHGIQHKLLNLSIKQKIFAGFSLLLIIILLISIVSFQSMSKVNKSVSQVVKDVQPAMIDLKLISEKIDAVNAALGFYLLSKDQRSKQSLIKSTAEVYSAFDRVMKSKVIAGNKKTLQLLETIREDFTIYKSYHAKLIDYAEHFDKNYSAMTWATQNMNPLTRKIQSLMNIMMQSENQEGISAERKKILMDINNMRLTWANMIQGVRAFISFRGKNDIANFTLYRNEYLKLVKRLGSYSDLLTFEQADAIENLKPIVDKYFQALDQFVTIHGSDKWRMDAWTLKNEVAPILVRIKENINTITEQKQVLSDNISAELLSDMEQQQNFIILLASIGTIVAVLCALIIGFIISGPIKSTVAALRDIAEGEGDLTRRLAVKGKDEIGELANAFNLFVAKVHTLVAEVAESTTHHAEAANHMKLISQSASDSIRNQQGETDQVATAVNEMAATVQEISRNASTAAEHANKANSEAEQGKIVVDETIQTIENLATEVEKTASVISRLENDSDQIGAVLDVIRGIAEQTNLLALNAAIEAARAGEQGRGFAVVADEVRNLASRTQQSTEEIHNMIERLQTGSKEAVKVMEEGRSIAKTSVEQAANAGKSLISITNAVNEINSLNLQIEQATHQQSEVADEINRSVTSISQSANQTAENAQELTGSSTTVHGLAIKLADLMSVFKT